MPVRTALFAACLAAAASFGGAAKAQAPASPPAAPDPANDHWRATLLEENDSLPFSSDKHYTQGLRLSFLSPELASDSWMGHVYNFVGNIPTVFPNAPGSSHRRVSAFTGQSVFTPKNLDIKPPDAHDRPYAGWLYAGASLLQETGNQLENLELELGVIGPGAFGRQTQNDWHQFIGIHQAQGWSNQLQNEPGLVVSYERMWRLSLTPFLNGADGVRNGVDIVPEVGGSFGNVFDYAEAGMQLRFGRHLEADYGPVRIRPSLSGTDYFNADHVDDEFGFYFFAGAQGRAVAHNIFLDGNSFRQSPNVEHKTLVADLQAGVSVFWEDRIRLDISAVRRTPEFVGQRAPDVLGTVALAVSW